VPALSRENAKGGGGGEGGGGGGGGGEGVFGGWSGGAVVWGKETGGVQGGMVNQATVRAKGYETLYERRLHQVAKKEKDRWGGASKISMGGLGKPIRGAVTPQMKPSTRIRLTRNESE